MSENVVELPELLRLNDLGGGRYGVTQPAEAAEGRDVVFSGQLLGQMIMAADAVCAGEKDVRSIHCIFARAGSYLTPIELEVDAMQSGRTWASDTVTATQQTKLLCRSLLLLSRPEGDLVRHEPAMPPGVLSPDELAAAEHQDVAGGSVYPGGMIRRVPGKPQRDGVPVELAWHRYDRPLPPAASQAVLIWALCGRLIALAMRPHATQVDPNEAHRGLSTGVIAQTVHFLDRFDVSDWLLIRAEATKAAGGRIFGVGEVFTAEGNLVATFAQDSMAKAADRPLDANRAM